MTEECISGVIDPDKKERAFGAEPAYQGEANDAHQDTCHLKCAYVIENVLIHNAKEIVYFISNSYLPASILISCCTTFPYLYAFWPAANGK